MSAIDLRLGPLKAASHNIFRSGVRWMCQPGQHLRPNQIFAYCNISLEPTGGRLTGPPPFADEMELHVAFGSRVGGRISMNAAAARGGYLDVRTVDAWDADTVIASIEPDADADQSIDASRVRLLMLAGRRMTALADTHAGLLSGWHSRSRGWWCEEGELPITLLSLGVCDATGLVLGEQGAFLEMFETLPFAAHMVFTPDHPIVPTANILLDQIDRTPAQFEALAEDLKGFFAEKKVSPSPDDLLFAGVLLSALQRNPIGDRYNVFSASGSAQLRPADAVLMSAICEPGSILRHRKLGYHVHILRHHQGAAGPAFRAWLSEAFEPVRRSLDDIKRDYETLIDKIARTTGGRIIVLNRMSTSGYEDISSYMAFDAPMSDTLSNIASKEQNLMLEDIAQTRDMHIVDVDAMAAEIGGADHVPDGVHLSGLMQSVLRHQIKAILEDIKADTPAPAAASR